METVPQSKDDPLTNYNAYLAVTSRSECEIRSELDTYLEENAFPQNFDFDILSYWKATGIKYPTFSNIALEILVVPKTTITSKSSFSTGGRCLGTHRVRLYPTTFEVLICSQDWLRSEKQCKLY